MEPNRVIGLCGQHEPGRGSSNEAVTICDGEAQLITATCGKANHREEAARSGVLEIEGRSTKGVGDSGHQVKPHFLAKGEF
ncbi:hypothetical protein ACFX1Q_028659 [Malus domestica]